MYTIDEAAKETKFTIKQLDDFVQFLMMKGFLFKDIEKYILTII